MTMEEARNLCNGVYRIHWVEGGAWSVASIGHNSHGVPWFMPANWISISDVACYHWYRVERVSLIEASPF